MTPSRCRPLSVVPPTMFRTQVRFRIHRILQHTSDVNGLIRVRRRPRRLDARVSTVKGGQ